MKITARLSSLALVSLALVSTCAQAQSDSTGPETSHWGLGLGVGFMRHPYRDFDDKVTALPMVTYENRWISVRGPSLELKLPSEGSVSWRLRVNYSQEGYEADDSPYLQGMNERKGGFWAGGTASWRTGLGTLSAELLTDASGNSNGSKLKLGVERAFGIGDFQVMPHLSANWVSSKYVDYYYGVQASEVRTDRAAYAGQSTVNVELGLRGRYVLAPQQSIFMDLSVTALGAGIRNSPLVDRSSQAGLRVGYLFRF